MSTARHVSEMRGTIHPTRTDVGEVMHAIDRSEIAWGRYYRSGTDDKKREWKAAHARVKRLVELLDEQNGRGTEADPPHPASPEESVAAPKLTGGR